MKLKIKIGTNCVKKLLDKGGKSDDINLQRLLQNKECCQIKFDAIKLHLI